MRPTEPAPETADTSPAEGGGSAGRGLLAIMGATVVAGAAGYLVQGLVPLFIGGPAEYLPFSVFWSTLYLVIAAQSGIQQEVTRATGPVPVADAETAEEGARAPSALARFTRMAVVVVLVALTALGAALGPFLFPGSWLVLVPCLVLGCTAYVTIAVLSGALYGLSIWWAVATMTILDAVLRLVLVLAACLTAPRVEVLALAVALPFPLTAAIMWLLVRRRVVGRISVDVPPRRLASNAVSAVTAAVATGILTSGFSTVIALTTPRQDHAALGALIFVLTLTRAPLVIPMLALQSYLIVTFRSAPDRSARLLARLSAAIVAITAAGSLAAMWVVPAIIEAIWPEYAIGPGAAAGAIASAGATALLCVSGPAVLARASHRAYMTGWLSAAIVMALALLIPLPLEPRVLTALAAGPLVGVVIHALALGRPKRAPTMS